MRNISIILACALAIGACKKKEAESVTPAAVEVAAVRQVTTGAGVRYSATVEPDAQTTVSFRVGGYVEDVAVQAGDRVAKGAVLARIRRSDYVERLGQASAQQAQAAAALEQAKTDLDRAKSLYAANAMTKPELDAAVARFEMTSAQMSGGRAAANEAGITLRDTVLTAPVSGVILRRNVERGDLTAPGAPAFVLASTNTVKVVFGVPDTMVRSLKIGQEIAVTTESMPDRRYAGRISRIAPEADPKSRSFDIELHIANADDELKPGMVASLEISRGQAQMLAVPLAAVIRPPKSADGYAVYVVANDRVKARIVELGEPMGNLVAVRNGLNAGEQVVVSGPALLVDGQSVRSIGGSNAQER
jgi:multidrug efflux system membrane fusion protein